MQCISQRIAWENIDLEDIWFTTDSEENPNNTPRQDPCISPENKNQPQSKTHVQQGLDREEVFASEWHECPISKEVCNT